jgi:branched-chain amino acid transport system substrate-binding protein
MRYRIGCAVVLGVLCLAGCSRDDKAVAPATTQAAPPKMVKIVSDLPMQGSSGKQSESIVRGIELYLEQLGGKAGPYEIEFETIDDSVFPGSAYGESPNLQHARESAEDERIVGVVGRFSSGYTKQAVELANPRSLVYVSPSNTAVGLTHEGPGSEPGEPGKYYPSGIRTYARVVAPDDVQARIGAALMKNTLGVSKVFVLDDRDSYGMGMADAFEAAAPDFGLEVVGHEHWDANADRYTKLMQRVKESGADGIYVGGIADFNGDQVLKDKVAVLGDNEAVKVLVSDGFVVDTLFEEAGARATEGVYGTTPTLDPEQITGAGREFLDAYEAKHGEEPERYTAYGVAAAQVLLDAIARSDGTREDIAAKLLETDIADGILGPTSFDENGDIVNPAFAVYRAKAGNWKLAQVTRPSDLAPAP